MHRGRLRGGDFVGEKHRYEHPQTKGSVSGNRGGQQGTRYRKRHERALSRPGTPNGVCIRDIATLKKEDRDTCRCGKHNRPARSKR